MSSQLEANTQTLNRAQQDKAYTESMLAQQTGGVEIVAAVHTIRRHWKNNCPTCSRNCCSLQARYTEDHPDVIKTKADIAEVKKKLAEINKAAADAADTATKRLRPWNLQRFARCGCRFTSTRN